MRSPDIDFYVSYAIGWVGEWLCYVGTYMMWRMVDKTCMPSLWLMYR